MSDVQLILNSGIFGRWKSVKVTRDLEALAASYELTVSDPKSSALVEEKIHPDMACAINLAGNPVVSGWVDDVNIDLKHNSHDVTISGRSITGDLTDCSADWGDRNFPDQDALKIISAICKPFGVKVIGDNVGDPFRKITVQPEETAFEVVDRLCKNRALIPYTTVDGTLVLGQRGTEMQGSVIQGDNLKLGSSRNSHKERFSDYRVLGQENGSPFADPSITTQPKATAKDPGVRRYRPKTIMAETGGDDGKYQERITFEANRRAGGSKRVSLTVKGWQTRGDKGPLWDINKLVRVKSSILKIDADMLVTRTVFKKSIKEGTVTELSCVMPAAFDRLPVPETQAVGLFG